MRIFAACVLVVWSSCHAGKIARLPGVDDAEHPRMCTGYLEASPGQHTFYWLVESEESPETKPLLIWMDGGPGASSIGSLFSELGPYLLNSRSLPDAAGKWHPLRNPHSWHLIANLLVWDQPAGVGYSYCETQSSCPRPWNDTTSTIANFGTFTAFLKKHPEYQGRDVYIAGESYGGIYVPLLAEQILNFKGEPGLKPAFIRGIAVGNGCVGFGVQGGACGPDTMWTLLEFMQGRGAVDADEAADLRAACGGELKNGSVESLSKFSPQCRKALSIFGEILGDYNTYNFGSPCGPDGLGNWGDGKMFTCGAEDATYKYLNTMQVRKAIGNYGVGPKTWEEWDGDSGKYQITLADAQPAYRALVEAGVNVFVYIGLRDTGGPNFDAKHWTHSLGGKVVSKYSWTSGDGHVAGRVTVFEKSLRYATIRGAGHIVPASRPKEAFTLIRSFVEKKELPKYKGGCQRVWLGLGWADLCPDGNESGQRDVVQV